MSEKEKFGDLLKDLCLRPTELTVAEFAKLIDIKERQVYRWLRNESVPRKPLIGRIAVLISTELDKKEQPDKKPFYYSDNICYFLERLLISAGEKISSIDTTETVNVVWNRIAKDKIWKLAYIHIPPHAHAPKEGNYNQNPTGLAIKYAEEIARLLGVEIEWKLIKEWNEVRTKVQTREVDGIAPFLMEVPSRFFNYRFAHATKKGLKVRGVVPTKLAKEYGEKDLDLSDFDSSLVKLIYIKEEVGNWAYEVLKKEYDKLDNFEDPDSLDDVIAFFKGKIDDIDKQISERSIPIFLTDNITSKWLEEKSTLSKSLKGIKIKEIDKLDVPSQEVKPLEFKLGFAFHPDEQKLTEAVQKTIKMFGEYDKWLEN